MSSDILFPCSVVLLGLIVIGSFFTYSYLENRQMNKSQKEIDRITNSALESSLAEEHRFDNRIHR